MASLVYPAILSLNLYYSKHVFIECMPHTRAKKRLIPAKLANCQVDSLWLLSNGRVMSSDKDPAANLASISISLKTLVLW